jgi:hypothetical protein
VDIDPQAVEITMMSLYLKALEGEKSQLPPKQSLLPELKYNIICGNSLIGPDIYDQGTLFADEERDRINAFDWYALPPAVAPLYERRPLKDNEKPAVIDRRYSAAPTTIGGVMRAGGFDCVIGNPPYVRQESLADFKEYFQRHYDSFGGMADLYVYFMERGIRALKQGGFYSIIVSSSFLRTTFAESLRRFLKKSTAVLRIVDFGGLAVFPNAKDTYVCVPLLAKLSQPTRVEICRVNALNFDDLDAYVSKHRYVIPHESLADVAWSTRNSTETALVRKIKERGHPLGEYVDRRMFYGIKTGLNEAFELSADQARKIISASKRSRCLIKPILGGEDIRRYFVRPVGKFWIVVPSGWTRQQMRASKVVGGISENQAWTWFSKRHKAIATHLRKFEPACRKRQDQGEFWWELRPCDYYEYFESPKIVFPDICKGPRFFLDRDAFYLANTAYCLGVDDLYLLGILNSKVFWFSIGNISIPFGIRAGEYRYRLIYQYMEKVPIRTINFGDPGDKGRHDRVVALVERMLELNKRKHHVAAAFRPPDRGVRLKADATDLERDIAATDAEIDNLVYELYGITDEERKIIEGA